MMEASDIIDAIAIDLGYDETDTTVRATILVHLNRAQREIARRSRSIQRQMFASAVAAQFQYALPADFLQMELVRWQNNPPLTRSNLRAIYRARYNRSTNSYPRFYDVWGNARQTRFTGTATGGDNVSLVDTGTTFTGVVKTGDLVLNTTDDSEATVTGLTGANQVDFSGGLAGGSDNTFAADDAYRILSAETNLKTLILDPAPASADATGVESIAVLYSAEPREITQADLDNDNDVLDLDPELETSLILRTLYWAYGAGTSERQNALIEYNTEYRLLMPKIKNRIKEARRTFATYDLNRLDITGPSRDFALNVDI